MEHRISWAGTTTRAYDVRAAARPALRYVAIVTLLQLEGAIAIPALWPPYAAHSSRLSCGRMDSATLQRIETDTFTESLVP